MNNMEKVVTLLAVAFCCANAIFLKPTDRITNGGIASDSQFPYSISLQHLALVGNATRGHRCGGALITLQHALTAASCTYNTINGSIVSINPLEYRVFAGSSLLTGDTTLERTRTIANFTLHPQHVPAPASLNDIAIITLTTAFLNTTAVPIPLPTNNFIPDDFTLCSLSGWGAATPEAVGSTELRYTTKYIYSQSLCTTLYGMIAGVTNVFPSMICAASYNIISSGCTGDEGNALVCNGQLTGVLFFTNGCAPSSYPEVYTRVSNYTTWIRSVTGGASSYKPEFGALAVFAIISIKLFS